MLSWRVFSSRYHEVWSETDAPAVGSGAPQTFDMENQITWNAYNGNMENTTQSSLNLLNLWQTVEWIAVDQGAVEQLVVFAGATHW